MKYNYLVKHNGVYYKAGEEVPDGTETKVEKKAEMLVEDKKVELKKEVVEEPKLDVSSLVFQDNVVENAVDRNKYTKTDIMKMPKSVLIEEFNKNGIEYNENLSNADMKKILVSHYGL